MNHSYQGSQPTSQAISCPRWTPLCTPLNSLGWKPAEPSAKCQGACAMSIAMDCYLARICGVQWTGLRKHLHRKLYGFYYGFTVEFIGVSCIPLSHHPILSGGNW